MDDRFTATKIISHMNNLQKRTKGIYELIIMNSELGVL